MDKILFICSANKQRSKTAEDYFAEKYHDLELRSAGTNLKMCQREGTNPLTEEDMIWADLVLVMEKKHKTAIEKHTVGKYGKKIQILNIPDRFKYYQKELIEILEEKAERYF